MSSIFVERVLLTLLSSVLFVFLLRLTQRLVRRAHATVVDDNPAHRLYAVGQIFGVLWVASAVVHQCAQGEDLRHDVLWSAAYGMAGFALFVLAGQLGVRLLLGKRLAIEIDEGNVAAALAGAGHHVAVALLAAEAASGSDIAGLGLASAFFAAGVLAQQGIVAAFRALTTYDDAEQIAGGNVAAALSYTGASLASAIVVARAIDGDYQDFVTSSFGFLQVAALGLLILPVRQLLVGGWLFARWPRLRGGPLDDAVGLQHDVTLAALDASSALATAFAVVRLVAP